MCTSVYIHAYIHTHAPNAERCPRKAVTLSLYFFAG